MLLRVEAPLRRAGTRRAEGSLASAEDEPEGHACRRGRQILYLRQNYHFGPAKIAMYVTRYHSTEILSGVNAVVIATRPEAA